MTPAKHSSRELYLRLLAHVRPYREAVFGVALAMVVGGLADASLVKVGQYVVQEIFVNHNRAYAAILPLAIVGVFVVSGVASFASGYGLQWIGNKVVLDLRREMFAKVLRLPLGFFDEVPTAQLVAKFTNDVNNLTAASTTALTVLVRDTVTIVALLGYLLYYNWKLTLITFVVIPPIALVVRVFSRRLRRMSRENQRAVGGIAEVLDEAIGNQRVVRIFGGQGYEAKRFEDASQRIRRFMMKHATAAAGTVPVTQLFVAIAVAAIIYFAAAEANSGSFDVAEFIGFIAATGMLLQPLKRLTGINEQLQKGLAACESVFDLIDEPPEEDRGTTVLGPRRGRDPLRGRLAHLSHGHPAPALDQVSLDIRPGETVALVGPSGSGKSSLIHLLPRFYHPSSGRITLDGHDIESLTAREPATADLARVAERGAVQRHGGGEHRLRARRGHRARPTSCAPPRPRTRWSSSACCPQGLATEIGENGAKLSGGQRQRIAIARAILKDAPILLLDEATSALDTESERAVQAALETLMRGRTTIVIAHRLSTIEKADRIVVLAQGSVVECGSHRDLVSAGGMYAGLHRLQFAGA